MSRAKKPKTPAGPTVRCAIYTRKSTEEGLEQEFNTLDAQRESGEAYIASQKNEGWECLAERYDDGGFSGGNLERPALKRLLADVAAGKVDCIVVYKVDRLSRSLLDFAKIMEVFDQQNVAFVSVTQQFNTSTPMGRLVLNVLLSFAQFEREIIGERIRDKIAAQRRKGKWSGGFPILGYDVDRSGGSPKLVINSYEARRVREIFELYLSLGSLMPVIDELANRGWTNKHWTTKKGSNKGGRAFDKGSLYALLTNPLYVGKVKHKSNLYQGEHEAIITPELFDKVGATLRRNGRTGGIEVRNRYGALLKGLMFCPSCNRSMVHSFTGRGGKRYRYYTCTQAIKSGRKSCPTGSLPAAEIERVVVDQVRSIAGDILVPTPRLVDWDDTELYRLASIRRNSGGLFWREALRGKQIKVKKLHSLEQGDFLISHIQAAYGAMGLVPKEFAGGKVSDMYTILTPAKPNTVDMRYIDYLSQMKRMRHQAYLACNGFFAERLRLNFDPAEFLKQKILLPESIDEQAKIADFLDTLVAEVRLLEQKLTALKQQKKGLMQKLLTGQIRVPASASKGRKS